MLNRTSAAASALLFALSLTACTEEGVTGDEQNAKSKTKATIAFDAGYGERLEGRLVEGGKAVLVYDDERVGECKGQQGGVPQYAVTAYYRIDDGDIGQLVVAGLQAPEKPTIDLEGAGELEIWFEATNRWGCHVWDSDFGNNYVFEVEEAE
jgi:hypothetical protein